MAKKYNGGIPLPTSIKITKAEPNDDRMIVETIADLSALDYVYPYIKVTVLANGNTYEWNGENQEDLSNWIDKTSMLQNNRDKTTNSLGYKYIRSDFDFTAIPTGYDNSKLEIRDFFDLEGGTITMPENSELVFNGGKFDNCTIIGNKTRITANLYQIFGSGVIFEGTFNIDTIHPAWFGAKFDAFTRVAGTPNVWYQQDGITLATDNTIPLQLALDFASLNEKAIATVQLPSGQGITGLLYVPSGINLRGHGAIENFQKASTRLIQKPNANEDILRFDGVVDPANSRDFWFGKVSDIAFLGDEKNTSGWAMRFTNSIGQSTALQDTSILENFVIRNFPSGGIWFTDGALPLFARNMKILFCNGYGIRFETEVLEGTPLPWHFQGINFDNISGDGNLGGLFYFKNLDRGGSINITNMKSEERINTWYGSVNMQSIPIVIDNCNFTSFVINGATHVCSTTNTGTGLKKKPGDLISITGASKPAITWSGIAIRVRDTTNGSTPDDPADPDPVIISGLPIPFKYHSGFYRNGVYSVFANDNITTLPLDIELSAWNEKPLRFKNFYFWVDTNNHLRIKNGEPTSSLDGKEVASDLHSYTDASLNSIGGVVNTTGKHAGKVVWNTSQNRPVYSVGSTAASVWVFSDGTTSNTPV